MDNLLQENDEDLLQENDETIWLEPLTGTRTGTALLGLLPVVTRVLTLARTYTALLGLKATVTRVLVLARIKVALLGLKALGSKVQQHAITLSDPTIDGFATAIPSWDTGLNSLNTGQATALKRRIAIEWDVTAIPDTATILNTIFKYHGHYHDGDCHIHEMKGYQPSLGDAQSIYDEAGEGTVYADPAGFPVVATGQEVDLGTDADTDLQNQLSLDWFAIGIQKDTEVGLSAIYSEEEATADPKPTLYVEYTTQEWHYERLYTALLGLKTTASRVLDYTRSQTALLGLKTIVSRVLSLARSKTALLGLKGIGSRSITLTRLDTALLGLKGIATRVIAYTPRTGTALLGLLAIASRVVAYTRTQTALLGLKAIASKIQRLIQSMFLTVKFFSRKLKMKF